MDGSSKDHALGEKELGSKNDRVMAPGTAAATVRDVFTDVIALKASLALAIWLSHDLKWPHDDSKTIALFASTVTIGMLFLFWRGAYRINARYLGLYDFGNLTLATTLTAAGLAFMEYALKPTTLVHDLILTPLIFTFLSTAVIVGARILHRHRNWMTHYRHDNRVAKRRTLILGAGDAGEMIAREINRSNSGDHIAIGFIDDNPQKFGMMIHGVPVLGNSAQIKALVEKHSVDEIIIAVPSASGTTIRRLVDRCNQCGARVRTLPAVAEVLRSENHLRHALREVDIEDLLRREPVRADQTNADYISAETVLVTGGGGSIGSELARQIAQASPANLVLFGKGENSIYEIEQELIQTVGFQPTCVIGDVRDRDAIERLFAQCRPTVVFHAAAHKHVPLMQNNVVEAVKNNVFATELLVETAARYGVRKFVYISTDKAVKPSSVMGATKRVGEMIVRAYAQRSETEFAIVRFGNVLGSRGSLIPMLKKQIQRGGPLRLTHPDMTRYFMTIPEAVQLILQAGDMGSQAELFILDMGQAVKIVDLAKDLVRLHGLVPGEDIEIQFTGVRPGEKTHEELVYAEEELGPTQHPKIRVVSSSAINEEWLKSEVDRLRELCESGNQDTLRQALMELAWGKSNVPYQVAAVEMDNAREHEKR